MRGWTFRGVFFVAEPAIGIFCGGISPARTDGRTDERGFTFFVFFFLTFEGGRGTWVYSFFFQRRGTGFIFSFF